MSRKPSPDAPAATFHWQDAADALAEFLGRTDLEPLPERQRFVGPDVELQVPLVCPMRPDCWSVEHYLEALPEALGPQLAIAMQAGAVSMARFEAGKPVATKTIKRYVVRGKGRAQPTHLKSKGKSRYGSRLRLQNALMLLEETSERLREWNDEFGAPEQTFVNAPVRLWADLFEIPPGPPFTREDPVIRIPRDLPRPTTEVLLLAYRGLCYGRIERRKPDSGFAE